MHKMVPQIQAQIHIPILHIGRAMAQVLQQQGIKKVMLLGTKYTMIQDLYTDQLREVGIEVMIPNEQDIACINRVISSELCWGQVLPASKEAYVHFIKKLQAQGMQGVILGCTGIRQQDTQLPVFDTAQIHAGQIARLALSRNR